MFGYIIWNINPEITQLFGLLSLRYYSLLFFSGLILGYFVVRQFYINDQVPLERLEKLAIFIFIGTIAGARIGHCLFYEPDYYLQHPLEIFLPFEWSVDGRFKFTGYQGLASHGGAIGVLIAIITYCRKYKTPILWVLDRVAVAVPVTGAFIRFGNFMNSEIIGKPTNSNYGVVFQKVDYLPRHPAQLYEAAAYVLIFILLYRISRRVFTIYQDGFLFGLFLALLFGARFFIEFFKIIQSDFESSMALNMGQILSLPFITAGIVLMVWKKNIQKSI